MVLCVSGKKKNLKRDIGSKKQEKEKGKGIICMCLQGRRWSSGGNREGMGVAGELAENNRY